MDLREVRRKGNGPALCGGAVAAKGQPDGVAGDGNAGRRVRRPARRGRPDHHDGPRRFLMFIPDLRDGRMRPAAGTEAAGMMSGTEGPEKDSKGQGGA
jgi:hypothetical protein